uniref:Uncharacterized protein n=1 Tax=Arundo donax TaxID=35708 RepID=A0A0A9FQZ3_ARUDO
MQLMVIYILQHQYHADSKAVQNGVAYHEDDHLYNHPGCRGGERRWRGGDYGRGLGVRGDGACSSEGSKGVGRVLIVVSGNTTGTRSRGGGCSGARSRGGSGALGLRSRGCGWGRETVAASLGARKLPRRRPTWQAVW